MADTSIANLGTIPSIADGDLFPTVDVSDTAMAPAGTTKKTPWSLIKSTLKTYFDGLYQPKTTNRWEVIDYATPSGVGSYTKTGLSAYRLLRLRGALLPATDNVDPQLNVSTNNGSSYDTGTNYRWRWHYATNALGAGQTTGALGYCPMFSGVDNASNEGFRFEIDMINFNQATKCGILLKSGGYDNANFEAVNTISCTHVGTTARDAIRIQCSSGNIASGVIVLEGLV